MPGEGQRAAFGGEQFGGGVAALAVVAREQGHGISPGEDAVGEVLEVAVVDWQPVGDGLAQSLEQIAAVEAGLVPGDPGRPEQLGLQRSDVGYHG